MDLHDDRRGDELGARASSTGPGAPFVASAGAWSPRAGRVAGLFREQALVTAASQAAELRLVAELAAEVEAAARVELARGPRVPGQPDDELLVRDSVSAEVQATLGVGEWWADQLVETATRLTTVLTDTFDALECGRLDLARARRLVAATSDLTDAQARAVEAQVLARVGDAPWDGPSPRTWRARIERAVVRAAPDAVRKRREEGLADRAVRSWPNGDGTGQMLVTASAEDVAMAQQVVDDLARQWPSHDPANGTKLSMDQRRTDSLMDVFRRLRDGAELPGLPVRREHDLGLVVSADTYFGSDTEGAAPGEQRELGDPCYLDPVSAGELARREVARGAHTTVLLTDTEGTVVGTVRLKSPPSGVWTPGTLRAAIYARLDRARPAATTGYAPTVAQADFVRARHPRCTDYDCSRAARRCDLDHDVPWPRGPTDIDNLAPRCRRDHERKTRGLVHTRLHPEGSLTTTMLTGLVVTTRPEPLPGYDIGERRPGSLGTPGEHAEVDPAA